MGTFSIWHALVVLLAVILLFGRGRITALLRDLGLGIRAFSQGMRADSPEGSNRQGKT